MGIKLYFTRLWLMFVFISFSLGLSVSSQAALQCHELFPDEKQTVTAPPAQMSEAVPAPEKMSSVAEDSTEADDSDLSKNEQLALDLGLTYLKAPVPAGYRREIISTRTYTKKDGTPGKVLNYYRYYRPDGTVIRPRLQADEYNAIRERFKSVGVAPTWKDVWLSTDENTHIRVLAKDALGTRIAIYHPDWSAGSKDAKYKRVQKFGESVSSLRKQFHAHLADPELSPSSLERVGSTAYLLLMSGRIRLGSRKYLEQNGTVGTATLQKKNVIVDESGRVFLHYFAKAALYTEIEISDPLLKQEILALKEAHPENPNLLVFEGKSGLQTLSESYLNENLRRLVANISPNSKNKFTIKDFRTWAATVKTVEELLRAGPPPQELPKRDYVLSVVAKRVSYLLNNEPGTARTSYIDPRLLNPDSSMDLWNFAMNNYPVLAQIAAHNPNTAESKMLDEKFDTNYEAVALAYLNSLADLKQ